MFSCRIFSSAKHGIVLGRYFSSKSYSIGDSVYFISFSFNTTIYFQQSNYQHETLHSILTLISNIFNLFLSFVEREISKKYYFILKEISSGLPTIYWKFNTWYFFLISCILRYVQYYILYFVFFTKAP